MARKKGAPERTPPQLQLPLPERQRHFPPIRQPERNTANGRLPAFRKCPPDLPSPATPARDGC